MTLQNHCPNHCPNHYPFEQMPYFIHVLLQAPSATARIAGSAEYAAINGKANFYQTEFGVLVSAQVLGLPVSDNPCKSPVFAFHIHSGGSCSGNEEDPFANTLAHYNPKDCEHPYHAGDLAPLFGNNGYAFAVMLSDRFTVDEIIGKSVVIHHNPDDFTTQPSGNSGMKIACGEIEKCLSLPSAQPYGHRPASFTNN